MYTLPILIDNKEKTIHNIDSTLLGAKMRFYAFSDGKFVARVWCDNPDCVNYGTRVGIPDLKSKIIRDAEDYCCEACFLQARKLRIESTLKRR